MHIRLMSDLHLEFGPIAVPVIDNEKEIVVVLAGDIGVADRPRELGPFIHELAERHKAVIYIAGNHEHYDSSYLRTFEKMREAVGMYPKYGIAVPKAVGIPANVHILHNESVVIDDVVFLCSTFWTNFRNGDPLVMLNARERMNDYKKIRIGPPGDMYRRKLKPHDVFLAHQHARDWLFPEIVKHKEAGSKVVVVTHHAPSEQSIAPDFRNASDDILNPCYASEYGYNIVDMKPNLWVHGHTHVTLDYMIDETRVVCNPRGYYPDHLNSTFDSKLLLEV